MIRYADIQDLPVLKEHRRKNLLPIVGKKYRRSSEKNFANHREFVVIKINTAYNIASMK